MARERRSPASYEGRASESAFLAVSGSEHNPLPHSGQGLPRAAAKLSRLFQLPPSTAGLVAELAGLGGAAP